MNHSAMAKVSGLLLRKVSPQASRFSRPAYMGWMTVHPMPAREQSTLASGDAKEEKPIQVPKTGSEKGEQKAIVSYWGVPPANLTKEDGSPWKWHCFRVCFHGFRWIEIWIWMNVLIWDELIFGSHGRPTRQTSPLMWKSITNQWSSWTNSPIGLSKLSRSLLTCSFRYLLFTRSHADFFEWVIFFLALPFSSI